MCEKIVSKLAKTAIEPPETCRVSPELTSKRRDLLETSKNLCSDSELSL